MNLEDRIKRRLLVEAWTPALHDVPANVAFVATAASAARIAALEAEHPTNLFAQTAVVRKTLTLTFDEDAYRVAVATALTQHDEEYL